MKVVDPFLFSLLNPLLAHYLAIDQIQREANQSTCEEPKPNLDLSPATHINENLILFLEEANSSAQHDSFTCQSLVVLY